jgi:hypothetical protein
MFESVLARDAAEQVGAANRLLAPVTASARFQARRPFAPVGVQVFVKRAVVLHGFS